MTDQNQPTKTSDANRHCYASSGSVTDDMLHAGVKKAVENGLLPSGEVTFNEYEMSWLKIKEVLQAALLSQNQPIS